MSARRISLNAWIVAVGAVALAVFMFSFNWYGGVVTGLAHGARLTGATPSSTGWQTFTFSRWVWLLTSLVALGSVVALANGYKDEGRISLSALVAGLGTLASALIIIRIAHHPGPSASSGSLHVSYGIKAGIWLGLVAALAIACGGYMQTRPEQPQTVNADAPEDTAAAFSGLVLSSSPRDESASSREPAGESVPPRA